MTQFRVYRPANWASLDYIVDAKLTELAVETARSGIWTVPTLDFIASRSWRTCRSCS